jgi:hypothetical protein
VTDVEPRPLARRHVVAHRSGVTTIVLGVVLAAIAGLAVAMQTSTYETWAAFWVAPLLVLLTVPFATRAARRERDVGVARFLMLASVVKIVFGTLARYFMIYGLYDGSGDSEAYSKAGTLVANQLRHLDFTNLGKISSTRSIEVFTGQVYAFIGPTKLGAFFVFSWLSLLGLYFFYFAFQEAFPGQSTRLCRWLLFLLPSNLFWPSSIGKDAAMVFALGLATYGVAKLLNGRMVGLVWFGLGAWAAAIVRAHLTLILAFALAAAAVCHAVQLARLRRHALSSTRYLAVVGAVILSVLLVVPAVESRFGLEKFDPAAANEVLTQTTGQTEQGGSSFHAPNPRSPVGYAESVVTVLFRPFIFEASDIATLISALESLLLLGLCVFFARGLGRTLKRALTVPFLTFVLAYVLLFCFAFGAVGNFGILCRQRSQLWPFVIILLAAGRGPVRVRRRETAPPPPEIRQPRAAPMSSITLN